MANEARQAISSDSEVKTTALAGILGVSARRVQQLAQDDILRPSRRGWFRLGDSVQRYISYLDKSRKTVAEDEARSERDRKAADLEIRQAKATMLKLEADELEGKMHRSEDVQAMTEQLIYAVRGALTALPGRLAKDMANAKTPKEASVILRREVGAILREIASFEYDPDAFRALVRGRRKWDEKPADDE